MLRTWRRALPERLSREDAQILGLESARIAGHICKVAIVQPEPGSDRPTAERLRERISGRLELAPRCRFRLAPTPFGLAPPVWVEDLSFDLGNHVRRLETGSPVSRARFRELVAGVMTQRLDRTRPLWQVDVVEELDDGSVGLIWRLHHCMVDGVEALRLGSLLLWDGEPDSVGEVHAGREQHEYRGIELFALGVGYRAREAEAAARRTVRDIEPTRWIRAAKDATRAWTSVRRELAPTADASPLDHRAGLTRAVAFSAGELDDFKRIGHALGPGITVNDAVLAVVAGAVRTWLERRNAVVKDLRVQVPVSLHRQDEHADQLGNLDSYFFVDLPVGEPDPVRRLQAINRETLERKRAHDAQLLAHLPLHRVVSRWALSPRVFTLNVSNVPGPAEPLALLGAPVRELYVLAEIAEHHALRVSVISASGTMFFGLFADGEVVPDLDVLAEGVGNALEELLERTGPRPVPAGSASS